MTPLQFSLKLDHIQLQFLNFYEFTIFLAIFPKLNDFYRVFRKYVKFELQDKAHGHPSIGHPASYNFYFF